MGTEEKLDSDRLNWLVYTGAEGNRWNGYTGMERVDGPSRPTPKNLDSWHDHGVHGSGVTALNEPTVVPR